MICIAIDGPASSGKTTIAKFAAKELGFKYIDTGVLYRALGYLFLNENIDLKDERKMKEILGNIKLNLVFDNLEQIIYLNDVNISDRIKTPIVSMMTSKVSAIKLIRDYLLNLQREIAEKQNSIVVGRDIGTVILPQADIKIYLTATCEERAKRRYLELKQQNINESYDDVLKDIIKRDNNDKNREISPLMIAKEAIIIDTSNLSKEESIKKVVRTIKSNINNFK